MRILPWRWLVLVLLVPGGAHAQHTMSSMSGLPHGVPDLCQAATITSISSGAWSSASTWSPARMPAAGDVVNVASGTTVTYDIASSATVPCVDVNGTLTFQTNVSTRLKVGTLMVMPSGTLEIGTPGTPVAAGVVAEVVIADQAIDTMLDPEQYGTGVIGFGTVRMHGAMKSPTFARVTQEPLAGDAVLQTGSVSGWRAGDRLVIPDTRHLRQTEIGSAYAPQYEELIAGSVGATTAGLASPLRFDHFGARSGAGVLEFLPHVANLSRNVIVRSESAAGTRGHVIFLHRSDVDIRYVLFKDLGRTTIQAPDSTTLDSSGQATHVGTNQIGRYTLHMHHVMGPLTRPGNGYQFTLIGNAVDGGTRWGITVHNSHYGLVSQNVVYNVQGSAVMVEDASTSYNVIEQNLAMRGYGTGGRDGNAAGIGFYLGSPNNYVRNNVAANFLSDLPDAAYGYKIYLKYGGNANVPNFPGADNTVLSQVTVQDPSSIPIREFSGNEVYGATESGMTIWWVGAFGDILRTSVGQSVVRNLRVWHAYNRGVFQYEINNVLVDGLVVRGRDPGSSACCSQGWDGMDYMAGKLVIRNADIQGMRTGIKFSTKSVGRQVVENSFLRNIYNIAVGTPWTAGSRADWIPPRLVEISYVKFQPLSASISCRNIVLGYDATPNRSLTQRDEVAVFSYDQVAGDDFQVYYVQQAPAFIMPQSLLNSDGTPKLQASPVAGLTNQQNWATYGLAVAGAIAPCSQTRPLIDGFVCGARLTSTQPLPGLAPPAAPATVRLMP